MENWKKLSHLFVTVFLYNFATYMYNTSITDVVVGAVCGGKDECSLAIYLTGFQQAIVGVGASIMMPLIGNLSDVYGRKTLLMIPLTLGIIPVGVLAIDMSTSFFYAHYGFRMVTAMVTDGGVLCLSYGYLADSVSEGKRVSAFGVLTGVGSAANLCSTMAVRLLSTPRIFQTATVVNIAAIIYMRIFLEDSTVHQKNSSLNQPMMNSDIESEEYSPESSSKNIVTTIRSIPSPKDVISLFKTSITFSLVACAAFLSSFADAGFMASVMYYWKAQFHFNKDHFAILFLIDQIGGTLSSMMLVPIFGPLVGEETLLCLGFFAAALNMFIQSTAASAWVIYGTAALSLFFSLVNPSLRTLVSKQIGPNEQGIAQGCIMGLASLANVVSPLVYSPISASFLSEEAPFNFPGFAVMCVGVAYLVGFLMSVAIKYFSKGNKLEETIIS